MSHIAALDVASLREMIETAKENIEHAGLELPEELGGGGGGGVIIPRRATMQAGGRGGGAAGPSSSAAPPNPDFKYPEGCLRCAR